jgi:hypothetical protein
MIYLDSKGFWRWCIAHRGTGFLDFFHHPVFLGIETRCFGNWMFPSSGEGGGAKTPTQLGPLESSVIEISSFQGAQLSRCLLPPFTWGWKQTQFRNLRVSVPYNTRRWKKSKNPATLNDLLVRKSIKVWFQLHVKQKSYWNDTNQNYITYLHDF